MSSFATAMNTAFTWNGALSNKTPDTSGKTSGRLCLFFKAVRGLDENSLYKYISEAALEDLQDVIILSFHIRDCRGGKGERELGRKCFEWLQQNHPEEYQKIISLIPEYGRWDDLIGTGKNGYEIMSEKLKEDLFNMENGDPVSLCAKWCPTENDSMDKKYGSCKAICSELGITPKQYRKKYISPLREYIGIIETLMCNKEWENIEYSKVPSQAMHKLKKAFTRNDNERFLVWSEKLGKGEEKVNAKQLSPDQLIKQLRTTGKSDTVCEAQWKVLEEEVAKLGSLQDSLFVVDVSGSMYGQPLDVAVSLGLLGSNAVQGDFHNHIITFTSQPKFQVIKDGNLFERYSEVIRSDWGMNTNLQSVFDLILSKGKLCELTDKDMPKKIFIVSDMQFDIATENNTNFEEIERKYNESGFTRPQLIFWNVNGSTTDFPVTVDDNNTAMISGFSPSIMKAILNNDNFDSYTIMRKTLDDKRYNPVRELLRN